MILNKKFRENAIHDFSIFQPTVPVEELDNIKMSKSPTDDFAAFARRNNAGENGHTNGDHYVYDDDEEDVEIDFEPQNGYVADTNMADPYPEVETGKKQKWTVIKNPER